MPFYQAPDGTKIHYLDIGSGDQTLVLIPGLGGDGKFWKGVSVGLEDDYRIIVVDHRGAGLSDRPTGDYSIPQIGNDVLGILDDAGVNSATFIGHSTGGMITQYLASHFSERVEKLVLSGTWEKRDIRFRRMFEARIALLESAGAVAYHKLTQALGYDTCWMEANANALDDELAVAEERLAPLDVQSARIQMLLDFDCFEKLGDIDAKTLVIGAEDDALIPFTNTQNLASLIKRSRLIRMKGGHFYPRAYPDDFSAVVSAFLKETNDE